MIDAVVVVTDDLRNSVVVGNYFLIILGIKVQMVIIFCRNLTKNVEMNIWGNTSRNVMIKNIFNEEICMMKTTEKFTGKADMYSKYRPSYPIEYINYLISYNALTDDSVIADIGSGTGILSRQLLGKGVKVIGVEPNDDMRIKAEQLVDQYPGFTLISATAEDTTLQDQSIDLITVAQAFHWFDKERFKIECRRILKSDSNVALVWNSRDLSSEVVQKNAEICKSICPLFQGFSGGIEENPEIYKQFFRDGKYEYQNFQHDLELDLNGFIGRNLSASYAPKAADENYRKFVDELTKLFVKYSQNDKIIVPNIARSYIGKV